jgi:hypothetical protein
MAVPVQEGFHQGLGLFSEIIQLGSTFTDKVDESGVFSEKGSRGVNHAASWSWLIPWGLRGEAFSMLLGFQGKLSTESTSPRSPA